MKTAIVTGAAGNLGEAVVKKFLDEGYKVIGTVNRNKKSISDNPNLEIAEVDLLNEEKAGQFIESVISKYKTIDVAVLTVGGFVMGEMVDTKTSEVAAQYRLNFETTYNVAQPVFAQMMKQKTGRIFMIGSRPGLEARYSGNMIAYGLSKSLIFRLAELMNDESRGFGNNIVTSVIVPGTIDTPQNREKKLKSIDAVKPEEIADLIALYCNSMFDIIREPVIKVYGNP